MPRTSLTISAAACFATVSALLALVPVVPFPVLTYLLYDLAEIPVLAALFLLGPWVALGAATACWVILNFVGSYVPIGPVMKYLAMLSTVAGFLGGAKLGGGARGRPSSLALSWPASPGWLS